MYNKHNANHILIKSEGKGLTWNIPIHNKLLEAVFNDKTVFIDHKNTINGTPDLVIRSTHPWTNEKELDKKKKDNPKYTYLDFFYEVVKDKERYFYQGDDPFIRNYTGPYMSWSPEPLRCEVRDDAPPIYELNTISHETLIKDVPFNSPDLKEDVLFWGKQNYYFDKNAKTHYSPFILTIKGSVSKFEFNKHHLDIRMERDDIKSGLTPKHRYNFVYIQSNCTQKIRETLFRKLNAIDEETCIQNYQRTCKPEEKLTRSYGTCQKTNSLDNDYPKEQINYFGDNWKAFNDFKFIFALENSLNPGYITEKIFMAFQGGGVPIYYGPSEIKDIFNINAFYYINDRMKDPYNPTDDELNNIATELNMLANDNSPTGWKKYISQPVYKDNKYPDLFKFGDDDDPVLPELARKIRESYDDFVKKQKFKNKYLKYKMKYLQLKNK